MVGWRNPARYLAPLALAAVAVVTYVIVHKAVTHKHSSPPAIVQTTSSHTVTGRHISTKSKFYIVKPNDTLSTIATRTGASVGALEALNPNITPDALHPGQRLRVR